MIITDKEKIIEELTDIQNFLEIEQSEDINEAVVRGNTLSVYMARSGKLLSDSKLHKDRTLNQSVISEIKSLISLPASSANKFIDTLSKDDNYLVNWADRINASCSRQLEWCRTVISKGKAELQAFNH
jgi:hypothetical protein